MRKKLFIYGFVACIVAVLLTSAIAFVVMRNSVIEETKISAKSMANMLLAEIENDDASLYDDKAKSLKYESSSKELTPYRITIIANDGTVLGDSNADISAMDNHADRPEVLEANINGVGSARRDSSTLGTNMLYVAVKSSESDLIVRVALPLTELRRMSLSLFIGCLVSLLVGGVVSLISAFVFSRRLAKPINTLANATKQLTQGNMDEKLSLNTNTELDDLAHDFNDMSTRLNLTLSDLRHKNSEFDAVLSSMEDGLIAIDKSQKVLYINPVAKKLFSLPVEITEGFELSKLLYKQPILEATAKCIAESKSQTLMQTIGLDEALNFDVFIYPMLYKGQLAGAILLFRDVTHVQELERLRSDFVANVSHELRTPLTSIKGYAQALRDEGYEEKENNKRFLDIIEIEADRLNILINDLMELSKIENKGEDIDISEHAFADIVKETAALVSISAKIKNVQINLDIQEDMRILANKDRIKQLLLNLMDNGIKYNKNGGELNVSSAMHNGMLKLTVSDNGVGIDKEDMGRLFERFYRIDKSRSKELGGTGLGLSIVKHIAELYGGSVTATSDKGEGTEFVVMLPIIVS